MRRLAGTAVQTLHPLLTELLHHTALHERLVNRRVGRLHMGVLPQRVGFGTGGFVVQPALRLRKRPFSF